MPIKITSLFPYFISLYSCLVSWFLLQLWIMWDSNCSTLTIRKQYPALWGTGTKTKVLSFCGVLLLTIIDKLNFFSSCNLVTFSSFLYSTLYNPISIGLQWSMVLLQNLLVWFLGFFLTLRQKSSLSLFESSETCISSSPQFQKCWKY